MPVQQLPKGVVPDIDKRDPDHRLAALLDPGSAQDLPGGRGAEVLAVRGRIEGVPVVAFCTDATRSGGALGAEGAGRIVAAIDRAVHDRSPVIGLWHSGGAKLADGVESMDGVGQMFAAMTRASGKVLQLSVVLGPAAGAAAYGPALTDPVTTRTRLVWALGSAPAGRGHYSNIPL